MTLQNIPRSFLNHRIELSGCLEETEPPSCEFASSSNVLCCSCSSNMFPQIQTSFEKKRNFIAVNPKAKAFYQKYFPGSTEEDWTSWKWQLKNRFTTLEQLKRIVILSEAEKKALEGRKDKLPLAITPYYASLIDPIDADQAIRRTVIPVDSEYINSPGEEIDPLHEDGDSPVPGIVHRYPDRVLFLVTNFCSVNCRYCTRSRVVQENNSRMSEMAQWEKAIEYIKNNPQIRDVLLSGGDPLTLAESKLDWLLSELRKIEHVEMLRIGTKVPAVLPQRITPSLVQILQKYHPLFLSIHFTHPDEMTEETKEACNRLADGGFPMGSQTVLLKGINDKVEIMTKLFHNLLKVRVKPYYLYQCDPIAGSSHFRTSVQKGLEIIQGLRGHTSGYAIPHYVIDAPGGGGKIPLLPEYYQGRDQDDNVVLKNYEGKLYKYYDPI